MGQTTITEIYKVHGFNSVVDVALGDQKLHEVPVTMGIVRASKSDLRISLILHSKINREPGGK